MDKHLTQSVYEAARPEGQALIVIGFGVLIAAVLYIRNYEKGSNERLAGYGFAILGIALIIFGVARIYLHPFRER